MIGVSVGCVRRVRFTIVGFLNERGRSAILLIALVVGVLFDIVALAVRDIDIGDAVIIVRRRSGIRAGALGAAIVRGIGGRFDIAGLPAR
ncbi:hypothetical protein [Rhodopseudomonas sp.]|uniref:hypothetical protein n=1 Tax=Rhodopseudomonas sp. TaxID=1078 RepID=UPI0039E54DA3